LTTVIADILSWSIIECRRSVTGDMVFVADTQMREARR
jgi:hypothetical protein